MYKDNAGAITDLCIECDGRGFQWKTGRILSRRTGEEIATTYTQGSACMACMGSGKQSVINMRKKASKLGFLLVFLWLFIFWFVLQL